MTISPLDKRLAPLPDIALSCDGILNRAYHLYQPKKGYRFGTDAIVLAASVAPHYGNRIAEFGAGAGAVSVALAHFCPDAHITAIEKDADMAACLRHNIGLNDLNDRIRPHEGDVTELASLLEDSFDCVIANPPFHHPSGTRSRNQRRALAHHGDEADLSDWVKAALSILKPKGWLSFIVRADRTDDVLFALRDQGAGGMALQPIYPYKSSPAIRVVIHAQKDVAAPFSLLRGLVLHHPNGALSAEAEEIFSGRAAGVLAAPDKRPQ